MDTKSFQLLSSRARAHLEVILLVAGDDADHGIDGRVAPPP